MRAGQRGQRFDAFQCRQLVDQHAHAHAPTSGDQQLVQHEMPGVIFVEDVGLQINRSGGAADQVDARQHRVRPAIQDQGKMPWRTVGACGQRPRTERMQRRRLCARVGTLALDDGGPREDGNRFGTFALCGRQAHARAATQRKQPRQQRARGARNERAHVPFPSRTRTRSEKCTLSDSATPQRLMP